MFKVITHDLKEEWNSIINNSKNTDIYYSWNYLNLFKIHGDGEPILFYFSKDSHEIINVALKRDISLDINFNHLPSNKYFDLISPYGYGGTLISTNNQKIIDEYFSLYESYCKNENIITEFVRFHPLIIDYKVLKNYYEIIGLGKTVSMDLYNEEQIWSNLQTKLRGKIRQTQRNGIDVFFSNDKKLVNQFKNIYESTMEKNEATSYYFFNDEFYESLVKDFKNNFFFAYAIYEEKIISMSIILLGNRILHYHLSGTLKDYYHLAPNNVILLETALWGSINGYESFHLGGGLGSGEDNLLKFKQKFNKNNDLQFHIGKKIFNDNVYFKLISEREFHETPKFFPEYRA